MEVPQKIKMYLSYYPGIPLLTMYPREKKTQIVSNWYLDIHVHCSIIYNVATLWKQPKCHQQTNE